MSDELLGKHPESVTFDEINEEVTATPGQAAIWKAPGWRTKELPYGQKTLPVTIFHHFVDSPAEEVEVTIIPSGIHASATIYDLELLTCPHCGDFVIFSASSAPVYGIDHGPIYLCHSFPKCNSYIGAHKRSRLPKGTIADKPTRDARRRAHAAFDPLWQTGIKKRGEAYTWLSKELGLPQKETHIGNFDVRTCNLVVKLCMPFMVTD